MTPDELARLSALARAGDTDARNAIVEANRWFAVAKAGEWLRRRGNPRPASVGREDLAQAGMLGLLRAAELWDPATTIPFHRYAATWIEHYIRLELREAPLIAPSGRSHRDTARWHRLARAGMGEAEIEAALRLKPGRAGRARSAMAAWAMAGWPVEAALEVPGRAPDPADEAVRREGLGRLREAMGWLDDGDRQAVSLRYGLGGDGPLGEREIGERTGSTRYAARLRLEHARRRLAEVLVEGEP